VEKAGVGLEITSNTWQTKRVYIWLLVFATKNEMSTRKETHMRTAMRIVGGGLVPLVSVLLLAFLVTSGFAQQKHEKKKLSEEEIQVLANLPLPGMKVNQMFVKEWNNKAYLYLHQPKEDTYALVDVTKPEKPTLVNRDAMKGSAPEGPAADSPLAITTTEEGGSGQAAAAELPTQTVNFVDMSDPKGLKTVKSFKGVTSMYSDDANKLVYLVNGEGLWVIKHRNTRPLPLCPGGTGYGPYCPPGP
jgi:hypothetical protein